MKSLQWSAALLICIGLMGCSNAKPYQYQNSLEIPPRPGVFSNGKFIWDDQSAATKEKRNSP